MRAEQVSIYGRGNQAAGQVPELDDTTGDPEFIRRLQTGELKALGALFERYKALVYRTALAITRDERAAEDILQECFLRVYTYAASIDPERPLRPWLYRVTVNLAYDGSTRKPMHRLDDAIEWLNGLASAFPAPDHRTEEKEMLRTVREVIAELPTTHRAVIVLHYMEDLSLEEIAHVMDLPLGTVKSRLHYARERLREMFARHQRPVPELTYEFT